MSRGGSIKQAENGSWFYVADIAPEGAPRRQVRRRGFARKKDAQVALTELLGQTGKGEFVEPVKVTVAAYLEEWLQHLTTRRALGTVTNYRGLIEDHVIPTIGEGRLQSLTASDLDRLYRHLLTSGRKNGRGGLSPRTVRLTATIIGTALSDAVRKGLVTRNVARLSDPPSAASARAPEMKTWTPAELRSFLDLMVDDPLYPLLRLASMTGMRRGELLGLAWIDLDLEAGRVAVRRQATYYSGELRISATKTDRSRRTIDLDPVTVTILKSHRAHQAAQRLALGAGFTDHGLVFALPTGAPMRPDVLTKSFDRRVTSSGLPRIRLHDLRHSHATHLIAAGVHPKIVSERLGHASVAFTLDRYGHVLPNLQAAAAVSAAALVDG